MKSIHPRLIFWAAGRKRRVYRNTPHGSYYVRFNIAGKDRPVALRTPELAAAKEKAKILIEDAYAAARGEPRMGARPWNGSWSTIGEIVAAYKPDPRDVKPRSAAQNKASLLRLVREGAIIAAPQNASAGLLTEELVKAYQRARMLAAQLSDLHVQERAAVSINSTLRQARSILAPRCMEFYGKLRLPDLTGFLKTPTLRVDADISFVPFPTGTIERIEAVMKKMPRDLYLAALLMLRCGLRNVEVEHAKWEWFRDLGGGMTELSIERRSYFKVKNRSVRTLRLGTELTTRLRKYWGKHNEWVIDRATPTEREDATHKELNACLRPILPNRQKCAYELRKHAGSVVLSRPEIEGGGLAAAAAFLGDSIQTTEKHYARYLRPVTAIGAEEIRANFKVVKSA